MSSTAPPPPTVRDERESPADWSDLTPDEIEEIRRDFAEGDAEYRRGECIPADEVLPRLPLAG